MTTSNNWTEPYLDLDDEPISVQGITVTPTEPNKIDATYKLIDRIEESKKSRQPRPLHPSFYRTIGSTTNREQDRHAIRHHKKHRISCRTDKENRIKRQVKSIRMRQSIGDTIKFVTNHSELYNTISK